MAQREAERLADALWRIVRPTLLSAIDAALIVSHDSDAEGELTPEDEARLDAWVIRHRQRDRARQGQGKRPKTRKAS